MEYYFVVLIVKSFWEVYAWCHFFSLLIGHLAEAILRRTILFFRVRDYICLTTLSNILLFEIIPSNIFLAWPLLPHLYMGLILTSFSVHATVHVSKEFLLEVPEVFFYFRIWNLCSSSWVLCSAFYCSSDFFSFLLSLIFISLNIW